jgi:membrane protein CcdC involved in cytochrome C biogenesis
MTTMETISIIAQVILATSIVIVWVFRFNNIVSEFKQYGLPELVRSSVGAVKTVLATILVLDLCYDVPVISASLLMAFLMVCAQGFHVKAKNPFMKYVPSALLLLLSLFVAAFHSGLI